MNNKLKHCIVAMAICFAGGTEVFAQRQTVDLTLEEALRIALSEAPSIKVADMEIERKDYSKKGALSNLFPAIDYSADYQRYLEIPVMYFSGFEDGIRVGKDNSYTSSLSLSLPIIAPSLWRNIQLTKADIDISLESARASRIEMVKQVKTAYYAIMMSKDGYEVIKQSHENAKVNANMYRVKFEQGAASEYDVLRAEVQVKSLEPGLISAENAVGLSKLWLTVLIGLDPSVEVNIENKLTDYETKMISDTETLSRSLDNNSTLKQIDLQKVYLEEVVKAQKASFSPTFSAFASYSHSSMTDGSMFTYQWIPTSIVGVQVSIPILRGGSKFFEKKKAELTVQQLDYNRDDVVRNLTWSVSSSIDKILASIKQVASNREAVIQAQKAYDIMNKRFEIGNSTFIEVNDANDALTNAKLAYYQAIHDYLVGEAALEEIIGDADLTKYNNEK